MARAAKMCLQASLNLVNMTIGAVGMALIIYSLWMITIWYRDTEASSSHPYFPASLPWVAQAFLATGIISCVITCLGHIVASTVQAHCLCIYMVISSMLLLVETALMVDMFQNSNWEKDLPEDPTGRFDDFKDFVKSNIDFCKWIGLLIVLAQGCSILLATVLRTLERDLLRIYESDDCYYSAPRLPHLDHPVQPLPRPMADMPFAPVNETTWKVK
ncbi:hypothetical protein NMG60_11012686 [Bertholletia excelsa]